MRRTSRKANKDIHCGLGEDDDFGIFLRYFSDVEKVRWGKMCSEFKQRLIMYIMLQCVIYIKYYITTTYYFLYGL